MLKVVSIVIILLILCSFLGCNQKLDPNMKTVKIEVLPIEGAPEKSKVTGFLNGSKESGMLSKSVLIDLPGSIELYILPSNLPIDCTFNAGPGVNTADLNFKIYVDGKEITYQKAPAAKDYYVSFVVKEDNKSEQ